MKKLAPMLHETLMQTIYLMPDELLVLPGHYHHIAEMNEQGFVSDTLGSIKTGNPVFTMDEAAFLQYIVQSLSQDYIKKFLGDELPKFLKLEEIDDFFLQYATRKLHASVASGGIFRKNDILDLMIVISLNLSEFQLISVDKDMLNFLKNAHPSSWNLSEALLKKA